MKPMGGIQRADSEPDTLTRISGHAEREVTRRRFSTSEGLVQVSEVVGGLRHLPKGQKKPGWGTALTNIGFDSRCGFANSHS